MMHAAGGSPSAGSQGSDDHTLLAQIGQGSQGALLALHRRYVNLVYSLALRILNDSMAAVEITQDVFMKLWHQPHAYDPAKGRFTSWLLTVTRYAAIDRLRQENRRPPKISASDRGEVNARWEQAVPQAYSDTERRQHLRLVLEQLPLEQRQAIELAYFGGMSQQDIAEYLGLPLGTVKTRMRLGMQKLRAMWQQSP